MPKFGQGCANGGGFFLIDKGGSNFGFSRGGHDGAHDLGDSVDGSIEGQVDGWSLMSLRGAVTEKWQCHSSESSMNLVHPVNYGEDRVGICGSPTGGIAAWRCCRSDWGNPTQWLSYSRGTRPNQ